MTIHDTAGANVFCGVDHNVDAGAVLIGQFGNRFSIGHVKRHDFDPFDFAEAVPSRKWLPGIGNPDEND